MAEALSAEVPLSDTAPLAERSWVAPGKGVDLWPSGAGTLPRGVADADLLGLDDGLEDLLARPALVLLAPLGA